MSDQIPALPGGVSGNDLVTALNDRIRRINLALATPAAKATVTASTLYGSHLERVSRPVPADASTYVETDRNNLLYQVQVTVWKYVSGRYERTQAQLSALAATLGVNDTGLLVDVTDFAHVLQWTGTAWAYADPSDPAGRIQGFLVDPSPTTGWHLCDGTANVPYLKSDGSTGTQTLPDLTSAAGKAAYLKFGSPASATVNTAIAPVLTMASYTPAGTNSAPALTMNSYTPAGSLLAGTFFGNAVALTAASNFAATGAATAVTSVGGSTSTFTPSGTLTAGTFLGSTATLTGSVAAPTFTGTPAVLTGTIDATAQPQNVVLRPWFRT